MQNSEQERTAKDEEERRAKADAEHKKPDSSDAPVLTLPSVAPLPERSTPVLPVVLLVAGGTALATGAVFGVLTLSARSEASRGCSDAPTGHLCRLDVRSAIDREGTLGVVADITLASGVVLAGVGLYLLASRGKVAPANVQALLDAPVRPTTLIGAGGGGGGLEVAGSF